MKLICDRRLVPAASAATRTKLGRVHRSTARNRRSAPVDPAAFAALSTAMSAAHYLGDYLLQRSCDAQRKGEAGGAGHRACASHVASYTAAQLVAVAAVAKLTGLRLRPGAVLAGAAVSAGTHYVADRRPAFKRITTALGKGEFYDLGAPRPGHDDNPTLGTGAHFMDQAWHHVFNAVASAVMALGAGRR